MATKEQIAIAEDKLFVRIQQAAETLSEVLDVNVPVIPRLHRYPDQLRIDQFTVLATWIEQLVSALDNVAGQNDGVFSLLLTADLSPAATVEDMKEYAEELGISLEGVKVKKDIFDRIVAERGKMAEAALEKGDIKTLRILISTRYSDKEETVPEETEDEDDDTDDSGDSES